MSMSDPISDMLTRVRNAQLAEKATVAMPSSKLKVAIAEVLKEEGYIDGYSVVSAEGGKDAIFTINNTEYTSASNTVTSFRLSEMSPLTSGCTSML